MDNDENIDDAVVIDDSINDKEGYGPLSQFMAEPSVSIRQYPDKVFFKFNLLQTDETTILDVTLEIPMAFKGSLFCQAIIAYCYCDNFRENTDNTKNGQVNLFKRFFSFLFTHDLGCENDKAWSKLLVIGTDLPYSVIHEFLLFLSENEGTGATSLSSYSIIIRKAISWASELNIKIGGANLKGGENLLPYLKKNVNPEIKKDNVKPKPALSQLFSIDYETGEEIQCPYSDSQLVTNLRWFAHWYLNIMRERRLFLRNIKWDENLTIYEVLTKRLSDGIWSLESNPVKSMFGAYTKSDLDVSLPLFFEASEMYAKVFQALLPSNLEIEQIENGKISVELENKLLWLEPLGMNQSTTKALFNKITSYQGGRDEIIKRITESISYNTKYSTSYGRAKAKYSPISLTIRKGGVRKNTNPGLKLADMILPTDSECMVMSWLLASDCIQWSNQLRLNLSDFKQSERGKTLNILTNENIADIDVNEVKIGHKKQRSKSGRSKSSGKYYETISYKLGDPLMMTYSNWINDMTEAQAFINKGKDKWFHTHPPTPFKVSAIFPISFLCAQTSQFRASFEKAEQQLKYRSEFNGQGAFRWLLSAQVKHCAYLKNNLGKASEVTIGIDAVRQSRIIFNEGQDMTDKENAKETAHNEDQVVKYREAGVAKERIQNGLKGNIQIANKMTDEALSILNSCHIMSVDEVQQSLHDPSGFTVNNVNKFINEIATKSDKYDVNVFGGIIDKDDPHSGIKIIKDKNSAMMMLSYIRHMESELQSIEENHDEEQVVKHLFEHAQWSILFERFPEDIQQQAKVLADKYTIPYPPLF